MDEDESDSCDSPKCQTGADSDNLERRRAENALRGIGAAGTYSGVIGLVGGHAAGRTAGAQMARRGLSTQDGQYPEIHLAAASRSRENGGERKADAGG